MSVAICTNCTNCTNWVSDYLKKGGVGNYLKIKLKLWVFTEIDFDYFRGVLYIFSYKVNLNLFLLFLRGLGPFFLKRWMSAIFY
jgi:hypothetical protein